MTLPGHWLVIAALHAYGNMIGRRAQDQVAMTLGYSDGATAWALILMTPDEPNIIVFLPIEHADKWEYVP